MQRNDNVSIRIDTQSHYGCRTEETLVAKKTLSAEDVFFGVLIPVLHKSFFSKFVLIMRHFSSHWLPLALRFICLA